MSRKCIDLTGNKYGRLTVIERSESYISKSGIPKVKWLCKCDCGNTVNVLGVDLRRGNTKSCGCLNLEKSIEKISHYNKEHKSIHGHRNDRLYFIWESMKQRCNNPNCKEYNYYGAEGKIVCEEWQEFMPFYDWSMANGYADNLTIERIDRKKGYSPDNCKWATRKEQANNRRSNQLIEYKGRTQTMKQWAEEFGINYNTLWSRINKHDWNVTKAFTTPTRTKKTPVSNNQMLMLGE